MKSPSWRERVAAARARGSFLWQDEAAWSEIDHCPAAEYARAYGVGECLHLQWKADDPFWNSALHRLGKTLGGLMAACDFDGADRLLDEMEDLALQLKREETTNDPRRPRLA